MVRSCDIHVSLSEGGRKRSEPSYLGEEKRSGLAEPQAHVKNRKKKGIEKEKEGERKRNRSILGERKSSGPEQRTGPIEIWAAKRNKQEGGKRDT